MVVVREMAIKVGLIGPEDSVKLMVEMGREHPNLTFLPFCYRNVQEMTAHIEAERAVDYWLFSGPVPYEYVVQRGMLTEECALYTPLIGSSLTSTLLKAVIHRGLKLARISFDTYKESEIAEVFTELGIEPEHFDVLPFHGYLETEKLVAFHRDCYEQRTADYAITCIQSVYQQLQQEGVPVLRVVPTRMIIRQTMALLQQKIATAHYIHSSIAVVAVEFAWQSSEPEATYSYKFRQQQLAFEEKLLAYAETVDGSLIRTGDVSFFIFTTRGVLDDRAQAGHSMGRWLEELYAETQLKAYAGIGYGQTVFTAEKNSRLALQFAKQYEPLHAFLATEEGEVRGPLTATGDAGTDVTFALRNDEQTSPQWMRVQAYLRKYGKSDVTANELATWLRVTTRNARRILVELEQAGLARVVGEERPGPKGRPRKVYRVEVER